MSGTQRAPQRQQQQSEQQSSDQSLITYKGFNGLNTEPSRIGIDDPQSYWLDGFMPVGNDNLRVLPDHGPQIYSQTDLSITIPFFGFVNIGFTVYCLAFQSDGSIAAINIDTLVATQIAPPGTITNFIPGELGMNQWGSEFAIIVANQPNGYFLWDGTTFYFPGDAVPGFTTVPTGVSGGEVTVYKNQVWITDGPTIIFSAPASLTDFSTSDGGGVFTINDSTLKVVFTSLQATNGYLYIQGDSSNWYISGVTSTGSGPITTTFTFLNADPEVGNPWASSCQTLGSNLIWANPWGVHVSYGGRSAKVSGELDGFYNSAPLSIIPSSAKAILFGKRVYMLLLTIIDQYTGQQVNKLCLWDEKRWWTSDQSVPLNFISTVEIRSEQSAYGTDGHTIWPLFASASSNFRKVARSKMWMTPGELPMEKAMGRLWGVVQYFSADSPSLNICIDSERGSSCYDVPIQAPIVRWVNNIGATVTWTNNALAIVVWTTNGNNIVVIAPMAVAQVGVLNGMTISTFSADMALLAFQMMPAQVQYRG